MQRLHKISIKKRRKYMKDFVYFVVFVLGLERACAPPRFGLSINAILDQKLLFGSIIKRLVKFFEKKFLCDYIVRSLVHLFAIIVGLRVNWLA